jgi:hypothetical protein
MEKKIREKAEQIKEVLEEYQIYQLQELIPCTIPPERESRIGQAQDHKGLARGIERIRSLPFFSRDHSPFRGKSRE